MSEITKHVGELLKRTRKRKGLTQKELGGMLGITESTYSKYEAGKVNPSLEMLDKLAVALNTKLKVAFEEE